MSGVADFARDAYDLFFQVSPITLTGGIAGSVPGGMLPVVATLGGLGGLAQGLLSGVINGGGVGLQDFPWRFVPVPGATAVLQSAATYPFANRRVAANATVEQPKSFSLRMIWPVNQEAGMETKLALFSSLKSTLETHNNNGGTYSVALPSMLMTNCLLLALTDATPDQSKQKQIVWQWDFLQPLISQTQAAGALNGLMSILSGGSVGTNPSWSGQFTAGVQGAIDSVATGVQGVVSNVGNFVSNAL
ncbi:MAG: hypothetical protein ACP5GF_12250 [Thiomonas sp.]